MRTLNYLAKTTILSLAAMSWFACAANDGGGENGKVPDDKKQQKIADYFSGYLEGNTSLYDGKGPLRLSEIEAAYRSLALDERVFGYDCPYDRCLSRTYFSYDIHEIARIYVHIQIIDHYIVPSAYIGIPERNYSFPVFHCSKFHIHSTNVVKKAYFCEIVNKETI